MGEWQVILCGLLFTASFILRIVFYKPNKRWLKDLVVFLLMSISLSVLAASAPVDMDIPLALVWVAITHIIADAIARRKGMNPKRHSSGRQPVRHGRTSPQPMRHGEQPTPDLPTETPPVTSSAPVEPVKPVKPVKPVNVVPEQPKPVVRQTLRACVRCGSKLKGAFCGECGYNHTANPVCLLRSVDPERLQISVKKI